MAIFGNFSDIPLPDVLSMVGQMRGVFRIWNHPTGYLYHLKLQDTWLHALEIDNIAITDMLEIRSHFIDLMQSQDGEFEFIKSNQDFNGPLHLPLQQVLLSGLTAVDEIHACQDALPSDDTFFKYSGRTDIYLDETLSDFWEQCGYYLLNGASPHFIRTQTRFGLNDIKLSFYKLRALGLIEPIRARAGAQGSMTKTESVKSRKTISQNIFDPQLKPIWPSEEPEVSQQEDTTLYPQVNLLSTYSIPENPVQQEQTSLQQLQRPQAEHVLVKGILERLKQAFRVQNV